MHAPNSGARYEARHGQWYHTAVRTPTRDGAIRVTPHSCPAVQPKCHAKGATPMDCCEREGQCQGIEERFDTDAGAQKLRAYLRNGPDRTTRLLVDALRAEGVADATLLDIGGGIGAIQLELLESGLRSATDVDAASGYLAVAREEAARRGYDGRVTYHHGDFVALAGELEPADIVTLHRVICCYHDMPALVGASVAKARRLYGVVYPRDDWWVRLSMAAENFGEWIQRSSFRAFVHPTRAVDGMIRDAGFERRFFHRGAVWQVVVYARG